MTSTLPNRKFEEGTNADIDERNQYVRLQSQDESPREMPSSRKSRRYDSKHMLFNEGDPADTVYEVLDGTVMLFTISENGRRTVIGFMQKGDYFGFVMHNVHSYFAQTIGKCVVRSILRTKLWSEIREHHRAAEKFLALESNALENARRHMSLLTRKSPIERVSVFLLEMARRQGAEGKHVRGVRLPMTRADIADYLGLVVETVCRCLTHLKDDGVIGMEKRGQVDFLDVAQLRRYASGEKEGNLPDEIAFHDDLVKTRTPFSASPGLVEGLRADLVAY